MKCRIIYIGKNQMEKEGVIKYKLNWKKEKALPSFDLSDLVSHRNQCFNRNWIGLDPILNVGFGNISIRYLKSNQFFISGSQTGHIKKLKQRHFAFVSECDIQLNEITAEGTIRASSESLTHASIYTLSNKINAVIHIHHNTLWKHYFNQLPTTPIEIEYGTVHMANEIRDMYKMRQLQDSGVLIMGGHQDGIIAWGKDLKTAYTLLEEL